MFQDEARFGRISDVRRCWAPRPMRPLCQAMLSYESTYAYSAVDIRTGQMESLILPGVDTACMQWFLNEVSARRPLEKIVMILDGAGWHRGNALRLPENIRLLPLPPYAPELNPVEHIWDEIQEKFFHNRVFNSLDSLEDQLACALSHYEKNPNTLHSIVAWEWIVNSLPN